MWKWEFVCWLVRLISRSPEQEARRFKRLAERIITETDKGNEWWSIFKSFPKRAVPCSMTVSSPRPNGASAEQTAIVLQGPVVELDDLTYETVKLYRTTMPRCDLIVSTWDNVDPETKERIESLGATVLTSQKPEQSGPHHLNFQIASTARGIQEAKRLGCHYVMKTRVDTRIHMADADQFCRDLLAQFPIHSSDEQSSRFVTMDFATRLYVPYHPSDMMMFGSIDDMAQYWSPDLCSPDQSFEVCEGFGDMLGQSIPEVVLCTRYLRSLGIELTGELDHWWSILGERFIVVDREMIGQFWPKYHYSINQRVEMDWDRTNMALCHFPQWLQIATRTSKPAVSLDQIRSQKLYAPIEPAMIKSAA